MTWSKSPQQDQFGSSNIEEGVVEEHGLTLAMAMACFGNCGQEGCYRRYHT